MVSKFQVAVPNIMYGKETFHSLLVFRCCFLLFWCWQEVRKSFFLSPVSDTNVASIACNWMPTNMEIRERSSHNIYVCVFTHTNWYLLVLTVFLKRLKLCWPWIYVNVETKTQRTWVPVENIFPQAKNPNEGTQRRRGRMVYVVCVFMWKQSFVHQIKVTVLIGKKIGKRLADKLGATSK